MKRIKLSEAHALIESADLLLVDGMPTTKRRHFKLTEEDDNEFLALSWETPDGEKHKAIFIEGDNLSPCVEKKTLFLQDELGYNNPIQVLTIQNLEAAITLLEETEENSALVP